jgi:hypothetical protein
LKKLERRREPEEKLDEEEEWDSDSRKEGGEVKETEQRNEEGKGKGEGEEGDTYIEEILVGAMYAVSVSSNFIKISNFQNF